jgi:DNA-binding transcriptional MocR family regulator
MGTALERLHLRVDRDDELPLGLQLARSIRDAIAGGAVGPGERLPSIRDLAERAGVHVNTVRAVYARLEQEGLVTTAQGRGTFVAATSGDGRAIEGGADAGGSGPSATGGEAARRRELRREIAELESELARRQRLAPEGEARPSWTPGALLTAAELGAVRDELIDRLRELDAARYEVLQQITALEQARARARRSEEGPTSPSLAGARVRFVTA